MEKVVGGSNRKAFRIQASLVRSRAAPLNARRKSFSRFSFSDLACRAIPQAGYIKLGALRYGVRISNLNLSDYPQTNKPQDLSTETSPSLIMSPSSRSVSANAVCNDGCCCIGTTSSKTRLPMAQPGEDD
jgi:hypothetical protein